MEYRKLISFGKSSYVVSLPKAWVTRNKLNKGDLIYIDEEDSSKLCLHAKPSEQEREDKELKITVDKKKSIRQVQREILSAYIQNVRMIVLQGEGIRENAKEIQDFIQHLVALEVMEQTTNKIVAKDFLNMKETDPLSLIKKVDVTLRSMLTDASLLFDEKGIYESISLRDKDVNKLTFLLYRSLRYGMENPSGMLKQHKLSVIQLFKLWWISHHLESIGDEIKRVVRYARKMDFTPTMKKDFLKLLTDIQSNYTKGLAAYYKLDAKQAHELHEEKSSNYEKYEAFYEKYKDKEWIGYLVTHIKSLNTHIHHIVRVVYQY